MGGPCRSAGGPFPVRRARCSLLWPPLLLLVMVGALLKPGQALQKVTSQLFGAEAFGTLAAFGDFNSDKQTDLFVLRKESELNIFLADQNEPYFKPKVKLLLRDVLITSVVPGDYNGDSQMDVLLTTRPREQRNADLSVWIFWGNNQTLDINRKFVANKTFYDEPLIMDFNGDLIPDIFGVTSESKRPEILIGRNLTWHQMPDAEHAMAKPHSHAFIDMNQDFTADLFLTTLSKAGEAQFEIWVNQIKGLLTGLLSVKVDNAVLQSVSRRESFKSLYLFCAFLACSNQQAFLLENEECRNASCKGARRTFKVHWALSGLNQIKDAMVATFFDIYEDGILDIIVLSKNSPKKEVAIHALKNNFEADAYFVKVIVLSGLCSNDCPHKITPFGVNQPGPYIKYTTVDANGYLKNGSAGQLSQSAHFALQLPYTVLGLGRSANFLDHLFVGIPRPSGEKATRKQEWTAIIPNSQLIVIPFPHHLPRSWSAKLYLTPSNIVLLTAIALIGVCVFILAIIGILHWQEKKADDREKRQEAHRFHFDAM
ncbi:T-cell immunomodulatory protein [Erythrolamprus reginae]|uniref:T-cell immunomodulatory protein n=1 Tax=Erythrolamprus reginae TaxID=121349 RepID=UPI00396C87F0